MNRLLTISLIALSTLMTSCIGGDDVRVRMNDGKITILNFNAEGYREGDSVLFEKESGNFVYYPTDDLGKELRDTTIVWEYNLTDSTRRVGVDYYRVGVIEEIL